MKTLVMTTSIIVVVIGLLSIFGGFTAYDSYGSQRIDGYAIFGGLLFLLQGMFTLIYISEEV